MSKIDPSAFFSSLARRLRPRAKNVTLQAEPFLRIESLEPRLLLSADPLSAALGFDAAALLLDPPEYPAIHETPGDGLSATQLGVSGAEPEDDSRQDADLAGLIEVFPAEAREALDLAGSAAVRPMLESIDGQPGEFTPHDDFDAADPELQFEALPVAATDTISLRDASALNSAAELGSHSRLELIVVDAAVDDYQTLVDSITDGDDGTWYRVLVLDGDADGVAQISAALAGMEGVDAIHLLAHGSEGGVQLGNSWLDSDTLSIYAAALADWGLALDADADLLIYGCDLAATGAGEALLQDLAQLTGADIAASDDLTGSAELGGDWDLEYHVGVIETQLARTMAAQQWQDTLAISNTGSFPAVDPELLESDTITIDFSAIEVADPDAGTSDLRIVLTTSSGGLLSGDDNHSVTVSGSGTTALTLTGELEDLNEYLDDIDEISFTGAAGVTGDNADAIGVIVNNDAGSGDIDFGTLNVDIVPRVITVTTTADEEDGDTASILTLLASPGGTGISLREALEATNNTLVGSTPDEIILPAGNYALSEGRLTGWDDVLITGGGARTTVIEADVDSKVFRVRGGTSTITDLTVTGGDSSGPNGGAIRVDSGTTLNLFNVTVADSVTEKGGGIHVDGTLNLDSVTLSGNSAGQDGGAIYFDGGSGGTLVNVTISGNSADEEGGGIWTEVPITVTNSTIAFNTAPLGGGIFDKDGAEVTLRNSILHNPGSGNENSNLALTLIGANIDSDGTAGLGGVLINADPMLGPLANNGGPTNTHLPAAGSPAIDAVGVTGAPPLDQRGVPRDGSPDIGAVEGQGNNAPTGAVSIDNTDPAEDDVLTASNTLSDDDGITPGAISYSWKADGATVGAGDTYTVTQNDVGKAITVEASYTDDGGTLETVSSTPTAAVLNTNDAPTGAVTIDNTTPAEGDTLTLSDSVADEDGIVPPVTYQWFQGASAITGETGLTYVTQAADVGETISVVASYSDAFGQAESVSSAPTDPVANVNFPPTGAVSIDNTAPAEDDVLTASNTLMDADGITSGAITYSWKADGASVGAGDTYTVTQNDVGKAITVEASYTDDDGTLETVSSGPTAAVLNINDTPTGGVTIDNTTPAEDDVLTASNTLMDEDGITPGAISYSWQADGSVVGSGATYTATQADVGKAITVEATYVDDFGIAESVASDATSNVTNINDDPTGTVSINNAAPAEDDVLTASNTLADEDGITTGTITYSWKADGATVGSGNTYTVTQNDVGKAITVEASYTDDGGTQETVSSGPTAAVLNTNDAPTGAVTIDNSNPSEDDVLTASNTLMDADGITPGAITYSWKADGATVGAGDTYTVTQNDVGKAITVEASYTDGGGTLETVSSGPTAAVLNTNDAPMGAVTIDNTAPAEGDTLTLSDSVADEDGIVPPVTYQWFQGASAITGETGPSYVTQAADVGETISVVASYGDAFGQAESVSSAPTDPVANVNFPPTGAVSIDNTAPAEDDVLTASNTIADADGITPGAIAYSWKADGATVGAGGTYTVTQNDVGKVITVEGSYTDDDGTLEAVSSAPTAAVLNINDPPTGAVSIDNSNPSEDDVLSASNTLMDADGITPGAITYSWKADGATVGAGTTYTATQNDVDKVITVEASYTDDGGTVETVSSGTTAAVLNINDAPTGAVTINNSNPSEDDVLTVSNTLADEDGITPGAITYSWKADGATVGAGATYTVTQNDVGKAITVEASYTDDGGTLETVSSGPTAAVLNTNDDPTGTVSIDISNPSEDDVLTASNTLMDADGIAPGAITYSWKADGATVGAGDTYTVTQNNVGKAITVEASYTDDGGTPEAITSVPTAAVLNINDAPTGAVSIDNTAPAEDDVLTASNTLADEDGITPGAITYSWKADGATVGAGATYTVTQNDVGKAITVEASYTDDGGTPEAITSAPTAAVLNINDPPTGAVSIDNSNPSEDDVLAASNTLMDADGITPGALTYSWKADGATVGAGATYTVTQNDVGKAITVEASYTDDGGTQETVGSAPTAAVLNINDPPTGAVSIDNSSPSEDDVLSASNTLMDADGITPGAITYSWKADGATVGAGATYTVTQNDVGKAITVEASYTDDGGTPEAITSAPTAAVLNINDAPTGAVTIDNTTPAEDDVLTASNTLADGDGIPAGAIAYTWKADGSVVGSGATYTATQSDVGKAITVEATYVDGFGTAESVASDATASVNNVNDDPTGTANIDNTAPAEDDVLTASNTLADADGITPGAITYSWKADGAAVGAGDTYTVTQNDVGKAITVEASYTDDGGTQETVGSAPTAAVLNINDVPTGAVTIDNTTPAEGDTLTLSDSVADEDGIVAPVTYQWFRGASAITGETGQTYVTQAADVGETISVVASYSDAFGQAESVSSAPTNPVSSISNASPTGAVSIDNTAPAEDDVLTVSNTLMDADGIPAGAIAYAWKADGATVGAGDTYTVTQNDVGKAITVEASYTDDGGTPEAITSVPTAAVLNINDPPTGAVSIDNSNPSEDDVLSASNTLMDADGIAPGAITYSWKADGATVGAGATYTVTQNDVGKAITVEASYTDDGGTPEAIISVPTAAVLNINDPPTGAVSIDNSNPSEDDVLTASNTLMDADGITPGAITYSWKADGATVGAGDTYTVTQNDVGKAITVEASYTDDGGTPEAITSAPTAAVLNINDAPTGTVSIDNSNPSEDDVLTASNTLMDADGITTGAITYSWKADGATVAAGDTYTVTQSDVGKAITVEASYTDDGGTVETSTSPATAAVLNINDAPTGAVSIDNTNPSEDDVLTASNTLADEDGITPGAITYSWKADGATVGAGDTYTVTQNDAGKVITVEASYTDDGGTVETSTSPATAAVLNINDAPTGTVSIDNTNPSEDDVLTASNTLADEDGITPGAITYSWKADGATAGAGDTYTVTQNDAGKVITVEASYTDDGGTPEAITSAATAAVLNINDAPTGAVTIDNTTPAEGDTLTLSDSVADEDGIVAPVTYQWFRGASAISGETGQTYVTQAADVGETISVVASYSDAFGQAESVSSAPTNPVSSIGNASPTGAVSIDNTAPAEDDVLTASNTLMDADGIPAGAIAYTWKADGSVVGSGATYTATQGDVGKAITVEASYTDDGGTVETVSSAPTTAVLNINDVPTGAVTIDNTTPAEDDVLTAFNTLMDADGITPGAITYSWKADGATVGAGDTYTVTQNDVGKAITVEASYTDDGGTLEAITSVPTAAVLNINDAPTGTVTIDNAAPAEDDTLTASNTLMDADGIPADAIAYTWKADGSVVGSGDTYTATQGDAGKAITVEASYTDDGGTVETVSSAPTAAVLNINDDPTGTVSIDNSNPSEDDILTASNTLMDADGIPADAIAYTWKADGSVVGSGDTYTATQGDAGKAITVEASYTDDGGTVETVSSAPTAAVLNTNDAPTGAVSIDNSNPSEDDILTASNTLMDADGIPADAIAYTWKADGSVVGSGDTYTATQGDSGKAITVEASYTDAGGTVETVSSEPTAAVLNINDAPTGAVTIDNTTPAEGDTLTLSDSVADEDGIVAPATYQWFRGASAITGETGQTYVTQAADVGETISVVASYSDAFGQAESVSSAPTNPVSNINDAPTGAVTIDNTTPAEDDVLTASNTLMDADGITPGAITYSWKADGATVGAGDTYTVTQNDVGKAITVEASYTDDGGTPEAITSAPTAAVLNINDAPTGAVTIDNTTPAEGDTLTLSDSVADEDGIVAPATYQWFRGASPITGETGLTYVTQAADVGETISVVASYSDAFGQAESVSSAPTNPVSNINAAPTGAVSIDNANPSEDDVLIASNTLADADGITAGAITYSWKADGATVGAGDTYTVTQNDVGKAITVEASYTDDDGTLETVSSGPTAAVLNINDAPTGAVTIDNSNPSEDDVLTASNTLMDADGIPAGAITYAWKADGATVGAGDTYTVTQNDVGKAITVEASYTDDGGTAEAITSAPTAAVLNINDAPTGAVSIDNTAPTEDDVLTASNTLADEDGITPGSITYSWKADGATVAAGDTYTVTQNDVGKAITVEASYTDDGGTPEAITSAPTAAVLNINDAPFGLPVITGVLEPGTTLSVDTSEIDDGDGMGTLSYQWQRAGIDIPGEVGGSYTLVDADLSREVSVVVSYTDGTGTSESLSSDGVVVFDNSDETAASRSEVAVLSVNLFVILERDSESENVSGGTAELAVEPDTVTLSEVGDDTGGEDEAAAEDDAAESESSNDVLAAAVFAGGTVESANVVSGPAILYEGDLSGLLSAFGSGSVQAAFDVNPAIKRDAPMREVIFNIVTENTDTTFDSAIDPLVLVASQGFSDGLDQMRDSVRQDLALTQTVLGGTVTLTAGFSIGYVVWLARSGVLISAAMSALPAWRFMDPLPILAQSRKQAEDDDDESLESMVGDTGVEAAPTNDNR